MPCHAGSHLEAAAAVTGVGATAGLSVSSRAGRLAAAEDEAADAGLLFLYAAVREGTEMLGRAEEEDKSSCIMV